MINKVLKRPVPQLQLSEADKITIQKIQILTEAVQRVYPSMKGLMWRSFVQGIFVGLGTTIGLAIVSSFLIFVLGGIENIPYIGDLIMKSNIRNVVEPKK